MNRTSESERDSRRAWGSMVYAGEEEEEEEAAWEQRERERSRESVEETEIGCEVG